MGTIFFKYERIKVGKGSWNSLSREDFNKFNSNILGLGKISQDGKPIQALAAIFDLEGFTDFCNQIDSHIVVPEFLSKYLLWLFEQISQRFTVEEREDRILISGSLPFFAKFLGDGILFIWDTSFSIDLIGVGNIIVALRKICLHYISNFLPEIKKNYIKPPTKLRCGIARGQIMSIGNGEDFVGPCINVASRLQKISQLTFAFSRRGLDIQKGMPQNQKFYYIKKINIRGIGEELIYVDKVEFDALSNEEKLIFEDV